MNPLLSWLVNGMARALEPDEREAVLGDFAEAGIHGRRALLEISGLVVRRQAALWRTDWRPWLALVTIVVPLGMLLSLASRGVADSNAIDAFLYVNNWTWGYLDSPGARTELADRAVKVFLNYGTLIAWSATAGFALGSLSRRSTPATGVIFCVVLLVFEKLLPGPRFAHNPGNAAVFDLPFYGVVSPVLVQLFLVLAPACLAMFLARRRTRLPIVLVLVGAIVVAALTVRATPGLMFWTFWPLPPWVWILLRGSNAPILLAMLLAWPAVYILVSTCVLASLRRELRP